MFLLKTTLHLGNKITIVFAPIHFSSRIVGFEMANNLTSHPAAHRFSMGESLNSEEISNGNKESWY